jgi:hypothetical protein
MPEADPSSTPANEALRLLLGEHAAEPSPERRTAALAAMLDAELLLVTPDAPSAAGTAEVVAVDVLSMVMADDGEGHAVVPVFTGPDTALAWQPDGVVCAARHALELFRIAAADSEGKVGIDLGSPAELVVEPHEIAALAEGVVPGDTGSGQVLVATPVDPLPPEVADAVRDAVAAEPAVVRAALFLLHADDGQRLAVVIEFSPETDHDHDVAPVMERIVASVATRTDAAGGLTMLVATPEWGTTFDTGGIELFSRPR